VIPVALPTVLAAVTGLLVGSFLNVCVHRLPLGRSIVFPGSHCPACGAPIAPYDNVPVLSWLYLRGHCRTCRAPISVRYPSIELANAILWVAAVRTAPSPADAAAAAVLSSACLVLVFVDLDWQILPDAVTLPLAAAGLGLSFFTHRISYRGSLLGIAAGAGGLLALAFVYEKATGREGMGMGDVKMLGAIGAFVGPRGVIVTVFFAALAGTLVGLAVLARGGGLQTRLPFGVFLGVAAVGSYYWAAPLSGWYRGFF
jgi:leader peptidase (prepilin peptidase)/N-methyltransferase